MNHLLWAASKGDIPPLRRRNQRNPQVVVAVPPMHQKTHQSQYLLEKQYQAKFPDFLYCLIVFGRRAKKKCL